MGPPHYSQDVVKWDVASLRAKLEVNPRNPRHIITVWGVGYRCDAPSAEQLVMQRDGKGAIVHRLVSRNPLTSAPP
ncbi:MAG: winged helix-turn-helix domain-containing protein [SAR202 cluster bacterium]|nr:winged helix-turn-helix domain-containing protein [SAR202 cluster bacterium]